MAKPTESNSVCFTQIRYYALERLGCLESYYLSFTGRSNLAVAAAYPRLIEHQRAKA